MPGNREYDNTNRFTLWPNKDKVESNPDYNEKWPDFKGRIDIDGVEHWFDAWKFKYEDRETGRERTGISGKIGDPVEQRGRGRNGSNTRGRRDEGRDDDRGRSAPRRDRDERDGGDRGPSRSPSRRDGGKFEEMDDDIPF